MAKLYSQEKGKFGSNVGFIYPFITLVSSEDPDDPTNARILPAGYLKCDGATYDADVYPALAGIIGVGETSKFRNGKTLLTDKFRVPDLGAKIIRASRSDVGLVNNATVELPSGAVVKKSGVGVTIENNVGEEVEIGYSGNLTVPARTVDIDGNPGWTIDKSTAESGVTSLQMQPHAHFSSTIRLAIADNTSISVFTYRNSYDTQYTKGFDTNIQNPINVCARNLDVTTQDAGNDDNTIHDHDIATVPGINHSATSSGYLQSFQITSAAKNFIPDGLVSTVRLNDSGASKFDDVISPYILVQYIIKF